MKPVRTYHWNDGRSLSLGERTCIMGILNVTADSFSDGGKWNTLDRALYHAQELVRDGADIIDIGAESSRPGFQPVSAEVETGRLAPFLEALAKEIPVPISVDTFKAQTAETAIGLGANIINDIWGLQYGAEPGAMAAVAARYGVPVVAMHNQAAREYTGDIMEAIRTFFRETLRIAQAAGIDADKLILDPGIGFGKTPEANLLVLRRLEELCELDGREWPLLLGTSRKSFIGAALGLPVEERMEATGATCVLGILKGCSIMRVHDVKPIARMCRMIDAIMEAK